MFLRFFFSRLASKSDDMSFWEHAEALRVHLLRIIVVLILTSIAAFFFKDFLFGRIICGPLDINFPTYRWICAAGKALGYDSFCFDGLNLVLINIDIGGQFRWHMIISFAAGLIVTIPYAAWQLWIFVKPALHPNEKNKSKGIIAAISLLFFVGCLFGYYVILPLTMVFLANYQLSPDILNRPDISSYISTTVLLPLITGLVFELPVLVYFLAKIGLLDPAFLKRNRKIAIVILLVIAGIITPSTDVFTQLIVAIPLYLLYEVSISVARRAYKTEATE
jgi:sec-independent protein translocase protein TatC